MRDGNKVVFIDKAIVLDFFSSHTMRLLCMGSAWRLAHRYAGFHDDLMPCGTGCVGMHGEER